MEFLGIPGDCRCRIPIFNLLVFGAFTFPLNISKYLIEQDNLDNGVVLDKSLLPYEYYKRVESKNALFICNPSYKLGHEDVRIQKYCREKRILCNYLKMFNHALTQFMHESQLL